MKKISLIICLMVALSFASMEISAENFPPTNFKQVIQKAKDAQPKTLKTKIIQDIPKAEQDLKQLQQRLSQLQQQIMQTEQQILATRGYLQALKDLNTYVPPKEETIEEETTEDNMTEDNMTEDDTTTQ